MNNNKIVNCLDPTDNLDVSNKLYVDNKFNSVVVPTKINSLSCDGDVNLSNNKLLNVKDPTLSTDAANKNYVDNKVITTSKINIDANLKK